MDIKKDTKATAKAEEVKEAVVEAEEVVEKAEEAEETKESKVGRARKTVEKAKSTAKKTVDKAKTTARKTAEKAKDTAKKAAAKVSSVKQEMNAEVYIQFGGNQTLAKDVLERVKAAYVDEGHRASSIKSVKVYVKPEENAAYYVVNDKAAGRIDLF